MRVNLQSAFVLHTRNYTDSRVLVELFTAESGRVGTVARSAKKGGRFAILRPFQPLLVSWQGKSELKSLVDVESDGQPLTVGGARLYCGMYLNELLLRVLAPVDPQPELFAAYWQALQKLALDQDVEPVLRNFELDLLAQLGYGIPFDVDAETGEPIQGDQYYTFSAASGFTLPAVSATAHTNTPDSAKGLFVGEVIKAIGQRDFADPQVLLAAKHLSRLAFQPLLGDKPLKSRELFAPHGLR
jgi:DNA repair protein RecO (recombination protein O)